MNSTEHNSIKRFGNTMRSTYERSSQESASKVLGYSASYSSIKTWFIFMKSAKEQVKVASQTNTGLETANCWIPRENLDDENYCIEDNDYTINFYFYLFG
jgi:hypothetical protein